MKAKLIVYATLLSFMLLVAACQGGGAFSGPNCLQETCVRVDVEPRGASE